MIIKKKISILFINLGTPKKPCVLDVARYLYEFLTDRRVIDLPNFIRHILTAGYIIPKRVLSSTHNYKSVWTKDGPPLLYHSSHFMKKIEPILQSHGIEPFFAMRYQEPSLSSILKEIEQASPDELIIFPLYPQYASSTTGSTIEACMNLMKKWPFFPKLTFSSSFYNEPWFIKAYANKLQSYLGSHQHVVYCFHGLPIRQVINSNPRGKCCTLDCCINSRMKNACYVAQSRSIAHAVSCELGLNKDHWSVAFQSRLGSDHWTEPYLQDHLLSLIRKNILDVVLISPSFVVDCLETIDELEREAAHFFLKNGGKSFQVVSSLNDDPVWIEGLSQFIIKSVSGT